MLGRQAGRRDRCSGMGYWHIHNVVDDHTGLACSELLTGERKETAEAFWKRAQGYLADAGIIVDRVMTDNGPCYRYRVFVAAVSEQITHQFTRRYRPQINGTVERFNRTALEEWAYARCYATEVERSTVCDDWLHTYDHHRGRT